MGLLYTNEVVTSWRNGTNIGKHSLPSVLKETPKILRYILVEYPKVFLETKRESSQTVNLPVVELMIPQRHLDALDARPPVSSRVYKPGYMRLGGKLYKVKIRYRGDTYSHWGSYQKSWRVKLKKGTLINGVRHINLINPEDRAALRNLPAYHLAQDMDVLAPRAGLVHLRVNNKYIGVLAWVDQINETFLRAHRVHPGNIYYGEGSFARGQTEFLENHLTNMWVWESVKAWDKAASQNPESEQDWSDLEKLVWLVAQGSDELFDENIFKLIDRESFLKFIAVHYAIGSLHTDGKHNWKLYFDPTLGKFRPIIWDPYYCFYDRSHGDYLDAASSKLHARLYKDPVFREDRDRILWRELSKGRLRIERVWKLITDITDQSRPDIYADLYKDVPRGVLLLPYSNDEFEAGIIHAKDCMAGFQRRVLEELEEVSVGAHLSSNQAQVSVYGKVAAEVTRIDVAHPKGLKGKVRIFFDANDDGQVGPQDLFVGERDLHAGGLTPVSVHAILDTARKRHDTSWKKARGMSGLELVRTRYPFLVEAGQAKVTISKVQMTNWITGKEIAVSNANDVAMPEGKLATQVRFKRNPKAELKDYVFDAGVYRINELLLLSPDQQLLLKPGVTLLMGPNASIVTSQPISMQGTKDKPIHIRPLQRDKSWGAIVVQGDLKGLRASILRHVDIKGGAGLVFGSSKYDCSLCVFRGDLIIENSVFQHNAAEDMVNVKNGTFSVQDSRFIKSHSDMIDVDYGVLKSDRNIFVASSNDGIDLSSTKAEIRQNYFLGSQDKAVSVGEASEVDIESSQIGRSTIGIAVKDASLVKGRELLFQGNTRALAMYRKNFQYDGVTRAKLRKTMWQENKQNIDACKKCEVDATSDDTFEFSEPILSLWRQQHDVAHKAFLESGLSP